MAEGLTTLLAQVYLIVLALAVPLSVLRLCYAGLRKVAGDTESVTKALVDVIVGLTVILTAKTIVWFVEHFAQAVAFVQGGQ